MDLIITSESRFDRTPDGKIWTSAAYKGSFWDRYLEVFDRVQVVTRVRDLPSEPPLSDRADGELVSFIPLPHYIAPEQYLVRSRKIHKAIQSSYLERASLITRVPSLIGTLLLGELKEREHPYGLEVLGDPLDAFTPNAIKHPLRPFFRWWFHKNLVAQCAEADAAAYVTERALQSRYPCPAWSVGVSDVYLPVEAFADRPHVNTDPGSPRTVVFVGTLSQKYKAPHILIDAVGSCIRRGLDMQLLMVGDGKHRNELEAQARHLGVRDRIEFLGQIPSGASVREQLDRADLFVLPSYTEGMPRAMLEAMARGLPCIGTNVGGVPELLPDDDMVPPGDGTALALKMHDVLLDSSRLSKMAERNLDKARNYAEEVLHDKRRAFIQQVYDVTKTWLTRKKAFAPGSDAR